jgi:hypothetical protein
MPPQSRNKGESKQGLVITLVFFILMTLGLGVSTYFGFAEQEKLTQAAKKAGDEKKLIQDERDWYKAQAMLYRSYMGQAETLDGKDLLGTLKTQIDQGTMAAAKTAKDREDVMKVLKAAEQRFGWNGNQPKDTYESQYNDLKTKYDAVAKQNEGLVKANEDAKKALQTKDEELTAANDNYVKNLKDQSAKAKEEQEGLQKQLEDNRNKITTLAGELEKVRTADADDKKTLVKQIEGQKKELGKANERIASQQQTIESQEAKTTIAPASMRTDWKIVRMDRRGVNPYINLGSADRVKPQLTFTIHGVGLDGRPNPQPKGTLEVLSVIGAHLSQARVTSVKDPDRRPILEGDVLYNASWNPTIKKHVALAGIMDITGDGRDSLKEFMRNLERQNIVVDAYLDPKDGTVKPPGGGITLRTDYLIMGESQAFSATGRADKGENEAQKAGREKMQADAKKNGVKVVPLHQYLEMIGYRLPRNASSGQQRPSLYDPRRRPDLTPRVGGEKPPAMKPDK